MATSRVPRVFLDTNVIFSGLRSTNSPPGEILRLHLDGKIQAVISRQIVTELIRNLLKKSPGTISDLQEFIANGPPDVVEIPTRDQVLAAIQVGVNADDAPILAAALSAGADYLISGDRSFIEECNRATNRAQALTPREFIVEFKQ